MLITTLSFENMHEHGPLMANLFRARKQSFIVRNNWDLPEAEGMEYDQYDTPASRWIAVHEGEKVIAGIRLTPTTAKCGMYSYMIRDAQKGMLDSIPSNILDFEAPVDPTVWESSRVFVSQELPAIRRNRVQAQLFSHMIDSAQELGAKKVLGIVPALWPRWIGRIGLVGDAGGPVLDIGGVPTQVCVLDLAVTRH